MAGSGDARRSFSLRRSKMVLIPRSTKVFFPSGPRKSRAPERKMYFGRIGGGSHRELTNPGTGSNGLLDRTAVTADAGSGSSIGIDKRAEISLLSVPDMFRAGLTESICRLGAMRGYMTTKYYEAAMYIYDPGGQWPTCSPFEPATGRSNFVPITSPYKMPNHISQNTAACKVLGWRSLCVKIRKGIAVEVSYGNRFTQANQ